MRVTVHDNGIVEFILAVPLPADGDMRVAPDALALIMDAVGRTLIDLEIRTNAPPALSFRPAGGSFELYRLTAAIPGTVQMRQARKGWPPRRKREAAK